MTAPNLPAVVILDLDRVSDAPNYQALSLATMTILGTIQGLALNGTPDDVAFTVWAAAARRRARFIELNDNADARLLARWGWDPRADEADRDALAVSAA